MKPSSRIYLDHAATSYPKPPEVLKSLLQYSEAIGASAGRGAYKEAFEAKSILDETRALLCQLFNAQSPERMIFTFNATDALNLALHGLLKPNAHIIVSSLEHNSISRPLHFLKQTHAITWTQIPVSLEGEVDLEKLEKAIRPETSLIAFIHGSNVSGTITPIEKIGVLAKSHCIPLLVDASQTAGSYPIDVEALKIDLLAFPGHKSLLGPLGTGGLWVREGISLNPIRQGGTGSFSEEDTQPLHWPDRFESGSHNLLGIVGLNASVKYLLETGVEKIYRHKQTLTHQLLHGLKNIPHLRIIAAADPEKNAGVVSIQIEGKTPNEIAIALDEQFRIQTRPGLHCSPWAHQTFHSLPEGTVRLSVGYSNTEEEIEFTLKALNKLSR